MEKGDLEMLEDRHLLGLSFSEIGKKRSITRQRAHQRLRLAYARLQSLLDSLAYRKKGKGWDVSIEDAGLRRVVGLVEPRYIGRIVRIINRFGIEAATDFLEYRPGALKLKGVGEACFLQLKMALLKTGHQYDQDNFEDIENKIAALRSTPTGQALRFRVLARDSFTCQYCGASPRKDIAVTLQVDHVKPRSKGGSWKEENLTTACVDCNVGKGATEIPSP